MGKKMDYGLVGMKMERKSEKDIEPMVNWVDFGHTGIQMGEKKKLAIILMVKNLDLNLAPF